MCGLVCHRVTPPGSIAADAVDGNTPAATQTLLARAKRLSPLEMEAAPRQPMGGCWICPGPDFFS